jgi:hypothetical protein
MGSFVVLYWGYSMHSPLNIGIRHIIPTLPFIYILATGVWKKATLPYRHGNPMPSDSEGYPGSSVSINSKSPLRHPELISGSILGSFFMSAIKYLLLVALVIWLFLEAIFTAPYFLSYYNEFAGGTQNGYHYATDSNYDWGQDLLRLQSWVDAHPEINKIAVDYFGGGNPRYYLGAKEINWSSAQGNPAENSTNKTYESSESYPDVHWLAISVNTLEVATQPLAPGQTRNASDTYSWLTALRPPAPGMGNVPAPDYRIGTSIFVYHL